MLLTIKSKTAEVIRDDERYPGRAYIHDGEGEPYLGYTFPCELLDEEILNILDFANANAESGYRQGKRDKAKEIRDALNVDERND